MQGHRDARGWTIPEAVYPAFLATSDDREARGGGSGMGKPSSTSGAMINGSNDEVISGSNDAVMNASNHEVIEPYHTHTHTYTPTPYTLPYYTQPYTSTPFTRNSCNLIRSSIQIEYDLANENHYT